MSDGKGPQEIIQKYSQPKILLIDLPDIFFSTIQEAGYNVCAGTFGSPYKVERSDLHEPVITEASLPNYTEQEIVIVNLSPPETLKEAKGEKRTSGGELDWWAKCSSGIIDPRPRVMNDTSSFFERIWNHGGLFVIFACSRLEQDMLFTKKDHRGYLVTGGAHRIDKDNWSFLPILSTKNLDISYDHGVEINTPSENSQVGHFLRGNIQKSEYLATFKPTYRVEEYWTPILRNKFGDCVGGIIQSEKFSQRILILPQLALEADSIVSLINNVLPEISPHLFPHLEGTKWIEKNEYQFDSVIEIKNKKRELLLTYESDLGKLNEAIEREKKKFSFIQGILTNTGDQLVQDVKKCLELVGFKKVVDVDNELKDKENSGQKEEDLHVLDRLPALLVEVKGISGNPGEDDIMQVVKYVPRRMKEWKHTDIQGVSIINHQRNIPPLDRDNNCFTKQQLEDANHQDITITTAWDFFRLIRSMMKWGWPQSTIQDLFYVKGRMAIYPTHYKPIGVVENYWQDHGVVGVRLTEAELNKSQTISYLLREGFFEEKVESMQVEKTDVNKANKGELVGIKTIYNKDLLRKGIQVFEVIT